MRLQPMAECGQRLSRCDMTLFASLRRRRKPSYPLEAGICDADFMHEGKHARAIGGECRCAAVSHTGGVFALVNQFSKAHTCHNVG